MKSGLLILKAISNIDPLTAEAVTADIAAVSLALSVIVSKGRIKVGAVRNVSAYTAG
jgi:hypothetical protein